MPTEPTGNVYRTRTQGFGIRWREDGRRPTQTGFATKTEARRWYADNVAPRLRRGAPSGSITFDAFADLFLDPPRRDGGPAHEADAGGAAGARAPDLRRLAAARA